jgi:hypothetical protein
MAVQNVTSGLPVLTGGSSYFDGSSTTATGAPTSTPGIAVNDQATLGGYWLIRTANGFVGIVKQTDIGPASWTGRKFDLTQSLLPFFGYSSSNYPTTTTGSPNVGHVTGIYLGKNYSALAQLGAKFDNALTQIGANPRQQQAMIDSLDTGPIQQGQTVDAIGPTQTQAQGQLGPATSGSSAVPAGISPPSVPDPFTAIADIWNAIADIWNAITNPHNWLRALELIGGALAVWWGIRELAGGGPIIKLPRTA